MDYGQLFERILQRPSMEDTLSQAQNLAQAISTYQTARRTKPVISALSALSNQYRTAQTDEQRQQANTLASQIRANYLAGGGSPSDLPSQYWGSDPTKGFQTTEGFQAPITGYEGLGRKEAMEARRQAFLDALTKRVREAELSGIDPLTGQKTWGRQYQEQSLANAAARSGGGGGGGSGGSTLTERINNNLADTYEAVDAAIAAGRTRDEIEASIRNQTPSLVRAGVDPELVIGYLSSRYPETQKTEEVNPLDRRPLWQKAIDILIPGGQFR